MNIEKLRDKTLARTIGKAALMALACLAPLPAFAQTTQLVSTRNPASSQPAGGNGNSVAPFVSADGRYVLFSSSANNLVTIANNQFGANVFLRDRLIGNTALVSVNTNGNGGGNGYSGPASMIPDGRFVLFESTATDLVPNVTNANTNIFLRDMIAGTTTLVSVATNGYAGNGHSTNASMTPDGRYVVFSSSAPDLVPNDTNGIPDVFVRDMLGGTTSLVSVGATATGTPNSYSISTDPVITPDGRFVAFYSSANTLVTGANTANGNIFLRDLLAGTTVLCSTNITTSSSTYAVHPVISVDGRYVFYRYGAVGSTPQWIYRYDSIALTNSILLSNTFPPPATAFSPQPAIDDVFGPEITPDGRFVAYLSKSLVNNTNFSSVHVWDTVAQSDTLVSQDQFGGFPNTTFSDTPVISSDGRYVAFMSTATNLTTNVISPGYHAYRRDLQAGSTVLVDADTNGAGSRDISGAIPGMSADGSRVAFASLDGSFVAGDTNNAYDVFLRDLSAGTTELVSARNPAFVSQSGSGLSSLSQTSLSPDGHWLVFTSYAGDLVANDFNNEQDVFVKDLFTGSNILVSVGMDGNAALGGYSGSPVMSANGRYLAFMSGATNLVPNTTNVAYNIFLRDLQAGTTALVNVDSNNVLLGNGDSLASVISQDGRYVAFLSRTNIASSANYCIFRRDTVSGQTVLLNSNVLSSGTPSMTADGRYVAYLDNSSHIWVWDAQNSVNIYSNVTSSFDSLALSPTQTRILYHIGGVAPQLIVTDFITQSNLFLFGGIGGIDAIIPIRSPAQWSLDGRFLAFTTINSAVPADTNGSNDVYLYDLQAAVLTLVSVNSNLTASANAGSDLPALSGDGRFVVFRSRATDIAPGITNIPNIFIYDRFTGSNTLLTPEQPGSSWNYWSSKPAASGDGRMVAFQSYRPGPASNVQDFNRLQDVFASTISLWGTADSDGDGIPDAWMLHFFGHATGQAGDHSRAQDDADGDGMSNLQEYLAGTDPTNPASVLNLQITPVASGNNVTLQWPAVPGKTYRVQYKNNLNDPFWLDLPSSPVLTGLQDSFTVTADAAGRFYRITTVN